MAEELPPYPETRFKGRKVSFDNPHGKLRLVGTIESARWVGRTIKGNIPDWHVCIVGQSGKKVTVSLVESKLSFQDDS